MGKRAGSGILVLLALLFASRASAQIPSQEIPKKVDAVFAAYEKPGSPGCALGVIRDGMLIHARGYGLANLEHSVLITGTTVFDIGSTSKQFTATAILLLAQQGKLSLDDDIRKHIPELPVYSRPITIRHLLHHTSGLRDYLTLMALAGIDFDGVTGDADALRLITRQKALNFTPGDERLYSNSGYFLLSVIVKRVSGESLREFAAENVFGPLGMTSTHFHDNHAEIVPQRAAGYAPRREGGFRIDMSGFEQTGDGAVYTTIEDLLLWDHNFYEPKVGGRKLLEQLHTTGVLNSGEKLTYAAGLVVSQYRGLKMVSHGGAWAGYRADLLRFPEQRFSVICLCNVANANPTRLARQVAEVYLGDQMQAAAPATQSAAAASGTVPLSEADLKAKTGLYHHAVSGNLIRITLRDGKLWLSDSDEPPEELQALSPTRFRVADWPSSLEMQIEPPAAGAHPSPHLIRENSKPDVYEWVEAFEPTAAQIGEFVGAYFSDELDVTYQLTVNERKLTVEVKNQSRPLAPAYRNAFQGPGGGLLEFTRDAQGRVTGFTVQAGRVRNIHFVRER